MRIYNTILNPDIWLDNTLKEDVRNVLLRVANDFYKECELDIPINDIILIGSCANYNWTPTSDLDVHIVIDFKLLEMSDDNAKNYTNLLKLKWNKDHDIHIGPHNVEMYIQDITHSPTSSGIYSVLKDCWIKQPIPQSVELDRELIKKKYNDTLHRIKSAIAENNLESMKAVLKDVYDYRQSGLTNFGEFSTENIVFKLLRKKNIIETLRDAINDLYDVQNSLNEKK